MALGRSRSPQAWRRWRHITKLDPDRPHSQDLVRRVALSGTDAIMISGTQNVSQEKVEALIQMVRPYRLPVVLEPSRPEAVVFQGVDYLLIPMILNAQDPWWTVGAHAEWIKQWMEAQHSLKDIPWRKVFAEGYIVLNPSSAVARVTKSRTNLSKEEVLGYAVIADRYLQLPILYVEYSGVYGDPRLVQAIKWVLSKSHLFYGGGIDSREKAEAMVAYATIVVGNVVYEDVKRFEETVSPRRRVPHRSIN